MEWSGGAGMQQWYINGRDKITINVTISRIVEGCYKITGMILKDRGILEGNFIL